MSERAGGGNDRIYFLDRECLKKKNKVTLSKIREKKKETHPKNRTREQKTGEP